MDLYEPDSEVVKMLKKTRFCMIAKVSLNCKVSRLHDLSVDGDDISSLAWSRSSKYLSVGTRRGAVQLWDIENEKKVREISGHWGRVGVLRWGPSTLASGSRDTHIRLNDIRGPTSHAQELSKHISEVCGMEVY